MAISIQWTFVFNITDFVHQLRVSVDEGHSFKCPVAKLAAVLKIAKEAE